MITTPGLSHETEERLLTRRRLLQAASGAGIAAVLAGGTSCARSPRQPGKLLGEVPFADQSADFPSTISGHGLDGRLALDLSTLTPNSLITPSDRFYIRTCQPDQLDYQAPWKIAVHGLVKAPRALTLDDLGPMVENQGTHLMECAGNHRAYRFGLLSAANWSGIPLLAVLERAKPRSRDTLVVVSGIDQHSQPSNQSMAGASWIFTRDQLESCGAFLATQMNGEPLSKDHGFPIRLVMPGWYGCTCIKWVNEIALVAEAALSTTQMREFAQRTHQVGIPASARDFRPATIDLTAMPVRLEKWLIGNQLEYHVVGILWGGARCTDTLEIRFNPDTKYVPVGSYHHQTSATWTLWTHDWRPTAPGKYWIQLRISGSNIPTRRLDAGYYARKAIITDV
jgi:DMSO/TMAO reductase YedYZ molybdopterin-dependent catalytic subunit